MSSTNIVHGVQVSFKTILIFVSHIGRHEGRKSEMVSRVVGSVIKAKERLELDLSPGSGKNLVSIIPATFVLTKCLLIEVESPVGFSLVNWWAREKLQYQEIDCKMIIHHGLLSRNFWTGSLRGALEGRTQERVCVEVWLQPLCMSVGSSGRGMGQSYYSKPWKHHEFCSQMPVTCAFFLLGIFPLDLGKYFSSSKLLVCQPATIWQR